MINFTQVDHHNYFLNYSLLLSDVNWEVKENKESVTK